MSNLNFFSRAALSSQTSRIPDETKKNPRTENWAQISEPWNFSVKD